MTTKAEMRTRVGEDLALVPIGQELESQDQARIDATFDEVYARLKKESLAVWASTAEVPDEITPYYALMMEEKLLVTYSVPESRALRIKNDAGPNGQVALAEIARLIDNDYESTYGATDY